MGYKLGVDVGGTFTDTVLLNEDTGDLDYTKTPSSKEDPSIGVIEGIKKILSKSNISSNPEEINHFIHGTTFATNAFLEKKGSEVALLTTQGFRDILEIGRQKRPELYNLFQDKPPLLVERRFRYEVEERLNAKGEVIKGINEQDVINKINKIKNEGINSVAIVFLHSYINPKHEQQVKQLINKHYPECKVSLSSDISPEFREYERTVTTVINAYLKPNMELYLNNLKASSTKEKIKKPYIMKSSGGSMTIEMASERVVETLLSGPAAGVSGSAYLSKQLEIKNIITLDMGGTSADVAMILNQEPKTTTESHFDKYPLKTAMVDMETIGAGGGSIASSNEMGSITVGPRSAGASPGPVCYGNGGTEPTITDANLILGRINPDTFHEGEIKLDVEAAKNSFKPIMKKINKTLEEVAQGVVDIANHHMAETIRLVTVKKGYNPKDFCLFSYGGASPLHISEIARTLNIPKVVVPRISSEMSAFGLLTSDIRHDFATTQLTDLNSENMDVLKEVMSNLKEEGERTLNQEEVPEEERLYLYNLDLRYKGQAFEISIDIVPTEEKSFNIDSIKAKFKQEYERQYGHVDNNENIEIVNYRMSAFGVSSKVTLKHQKEGDKTPSESARKSTRQVFLNSINNYENIPIYERKDCLANNQILGPAIVEAVDTTIMLEKDDLARFDLLGNIIIEIGGEKNEK